MKTQHIGAGEQPLTFFLVGILITYFFVPDIKGDDLAIADEKFRLYLVSKGWKGEMGEDDLQALAGEGIPESVLESTGIEHGADKS